MLDLIFALVLAQSSAEAIRQVIQLGEDEVGRPCAMKLTPRLEVEIEGQWYGRPEKIAFVPTTDDPAASVPATRTGRLGATVFARGDNTPAELDLEMRHGRGTYFTLVLPSATGYAHGCRFAADVPDQSL